MSSGGAIFGKGAKGRVMDLACVDSQSFCHMLVSAMTDRGLPEITVYSLKDKQRRLDHEGSLQFLSALSVAEGLLVKQFTRSGTKAAANFNNEFEGIQTLHDVFGTTGVLQHTTVAFLPNTDTVGFSVNHRDYFVLNRKCGRDVGSLVVTLKLHDILKMMKDVLGTLDILARHDFFHMDLKLDNILWCPDTDRYTVIDWDHGLKRSQLERMLVRDRNGDAYGSGLTASPIAIFLDTGKTQATKYASAIAVYAYMNFIRKQSMSLAEARDFMAFVEKRIQIPVKALLTTHTLFRQYYRNFDVFSLGICLALLVFTRDLPHSFLELADSMVNVSHPRFAYTPSIALSNLERLFGGSK
jgi:serine/threonine protein kinase